MAHRAKGCVAVQGGGPISSHNQHAGCALSAQGRTVVALWLRGHGRLARCAFYLLPLPRQRARHPRALDGEDIEFYCVKFITTVRVAERARNVRDHCSRARWQRHRHGSYGLDEIRLVEKVLECLAIATQVLGSRQRRRLENIACCEGLP